MSVRLQHATERLQGTLRRTEEEEEEEETVAFKTVRPVQQQK